MKQLDMKNSISNLSTPGSHHAFYRDRTISAGRDQGRGLACQCLGYILALVLAWWAQALHADQSYGYRYHYVSLSDVELPPGFNQFSPSAIDNSGRVYGAVWDSSSVAHVAVYAHRAVTVLQPGYPSVANNRGTIGGSVTDSETGKSQAALFRRDRVKMIPFLPGETQTNVVSINDSNTALVWSEDPAGLVRNTYRLYSKGKTLFSYQLPTGSDCSSCWGVNNQGIVTGTIFDPDLNAFRAIQFRPPLYKPQLLDPIGSDTDSTSFGINNSGKILGVSNSFLGDPTKNRYGIWNRRGHFQVFFEGINFFALFNDSNLIVLSQNFDTDRNSYLVPAPGVRLNLVDLVDNPSAVTASFLTQAVDINDRGDIIGFGACASLPCTFLLRRVLPSNP